MKRDKITALMVFLSVVLLIPVSLLPFFLGFGGYVVAGVSLAGSLLFSLYGWQLFRKGDMASAKKVMFTSFFYLPLIQLVLLFDLIV